MEFLTLNLRRARRAEVLHIEVWGASGSSAQASKMSAERGGSDHLRNRHEPGPTATTPPRHITTTTEQAHPHARGVLRQIEVVRGLGGLDPGAPPPYVAITHMHFDSVDAVQTAFGPHLETITGDEPNFTNIQVKVQISEVVT